MNIEEIDSEIERLTNLKKEVQLKEQILPRIEAVQTRLVDDFAELKTLYQKAGLIFWADDELQKLKNTVNQQDPNWYDSSCYGESTESWSIGKGSVDWNTSSYC